MKLPHPARSPALTLALAGVVTALAILGMQRLRISTSLGALLDPDAASVRAAEALGARFGAGHELIIALRPDGADRVAQAEQLSAALRERAGAGAPIGAVRIDRPGEPGGRLARIIAPAALYYLDDAGFEEALHRLEPDQMRWRIERLETLLAAPGGAAAAAAKQTALDPLGIRELIAQSSVIAGASPPVVDARAAPVLVRVSSTAPADDLAASERLVATVRSVIDALGVEDAEIAGAPAIAAHASTSIRRDMRRAILSSALLIQVVFLIAYRRPLALLIVSAPAALGVTWAFGAMSILHPELTALTAAIGGALAGLGVDYAIHLASGSHAPGEQSRRGPGRRLAMAILCAAVTSVLGFSALALSHMAALRGLALIGALGLAGATVATLWVASALLQLLGGAAARNTWSTAAVSRISGSPRRWIMTAGLVVAVGGAVAGIRSVDADPWLEASSEVAHPAPNPPLRAQQRLAEVGVVPATLPVLIEAPESELIERCREAARALDEARNQGLAITGALGLHTIIPQPAAAARREARLGAIDPDLVRRNFRAAVDASALAPGALADYELFLARLVAARAPTLAGVRDEAASVGLLPDSGPADAALLVVRLAAPLRDSTARREAVEGVRRVLRSVDGAILTGPVTLGADAFAALGRDLPRLAAVGAGFAVLWLLVFFRRPLDVALAAAPAVCGFILLLGLMSLLGWRFNIINMAALPLLAGIGVDDGIFLVAAARDGSGRLLPRRDLAARLGASAHAIMVTTATTSLAFGSLALTSVPGVRSLGLMLGAGAIGALCGALFLLVPLLALRAPASPEQEGAAGSVAGVCRCSCCLASCSRAAARPVLG